MSKKEKQVQEQVAQEAPKKKGGCGGCLFKCLLFLMLLGAISGTLNGSKEGGSSSSTQGNAVISAVAPTIAPTAIPTAVPIAVPTNTPIPDPTTAPTPTPIPHIYDNAEIRDVHNGTGTAVIGKFSLIRAPYDECTEEALADWYYNHVKDGGYNWCMILYSDRSDLSGVYCSTSLIHKDVFFVEDAFNQYSLGDTSSVEIYVPNEGTITLL